MSNYCRWVLEVWLSPWLLALFPTSIWGHRGTIPLLPGKMKKHIIFTVAPSISMSWEWIRSWKCQSLSKKRSVCQHCNGHRCEINSASLPKIDFQIMLLLTKYLLSVVVIGSRGGNSYQLIYCLAWTLFFFFFFFIWSSNLQESCHVVNSKCAAVSRLCLPSVSPVCVSRLCLSSVWSSKLGGTSVI